MSLTPPEKVRKLQETLHAKAKGSPGYRFYALYDKVYRRDVLGFAFDRCRSNGGAPGIDGQTFADIEAYGVEKWLDELADELRGYPVLIACNLRYLNGTAFFDVSGLNTLSMR